MKAQKRLKETNERGGVYAAGEAAGGEVRRFPFPPQMKILLKALKSARDGNFTVRLPAENRLGEIAEVFNDFVSLNQNFTNEIVRVGRVVGEEGRLTERASLAGIGGSWKTSVDSLNTMINALAQPTTEVGRVITAVATGDLSKKMRLEIEGRPLKGEFLQIGTIVNIMVEQLGSFSSELTRVAREVGTEGKLRGSGNCERCSRHMEGFD